MRKKLLTGTVTGILASAMILGSSVPVLAADTETIHYQFTPVTNVSELTVGDDIIMLSTQMNPNDAIVSLPPGSAIVKYAGDFIEGETDSYFGHAMYKADGTPMAQGCVEVDSIGAGFDSCEAGTIAYVTSADISAATNAGYTKGYIYYTKDQTFTDIGEWYIQWDFEDSSRGCSTLEEYAQLLASEEGYTYTTFEDYCHHYGEILIHNDYEDYKEYDPEYLEEMGIHNFDEYFNYMYPCNPNPRPDGWYYGCDGGGVAYVGPFYIYKFTSTQFTSGDITAQMKPGYIFPSEETVVTPDDVVVTITINGQTYNVPYFEIDPSNNTLGPNENNTITVLVGNVSVEVTATPNETPTTKPEGVQTSDTSNIVLFAGLGIAAASAIAIIGAKKRSEV